MKQRLLICADWFDPGFRAGGPIRSCVNLVELLGDISEVAVITSDCDLGESRPYANLTSDLWSNWRGKARVRYCCLPFQRMVQLVVMLRRWKPQAVYLNSMFSVAGTLWPLLWVFLTRPSVRVVLAPRGMLKPSALAQKSWKKRPILAMLRALGLVRKITFHATSTDEVSEVRAAFGAVSVVLLNNVPCVPLKHPATHSRSAEQLSLCFLGRVHPIKNLLWLLESMKGVDCRCHLVVVGPIEDQRCYEQCLRAVEQLPSSVTVEFVGAKTEKEVRELLLASDAMILPTLGENFGHAIFESLAVGTPVIISDQTIWRGLVEQKAGWDLPLVPEAFVGAICQLAGMNDPEYHALRQNALAVAHRFLDANNFVVDYQRMFWGDSVSSCTGP
ncbi:MAG: glycosyltransferase [Planctomycetaceae bacterium]